MAATSFHARSNSLHPRPHPLVSLVDEHLSSLRTSQYASTCSSSLNKNLNSLQDLHDAVEKLLQLPSTRQTLDKDHADELLDGSLRLLDMCNIAKDALLQTKESVQEIQSVLRRKRASEAELAKEVNNYLRSKKTIRNAILKALKNLNHKENKHSSSSSQLISILGEVEAASLNVLQSLLFFIAGPEVERKTIQWRSVSKLFRNKRVRCEKEQDMNEIANAEAALCSLIKAGFAMTANVQNELQRSESCLEGLEEGIEFLFRGLIKARVTLLNILN